jgi:undecaprenyl pyrophosphate synthase
MTPTRWLRIPIERLLAARLRRELRGLPIPAHLGLIMDGNRRFRELDLLRALRTYARRRASV